MKRVYIATIMTALVLVLIFGIYAVIIHPKPVTEVLKVGFIYENDESTPYTYNFVRAQEHMEKEYEGRVQVYVRNNVPETEVEEPVRELVHKGVPFDFHQLL